MYLLREKNENICIEMVIFIAEETISMVYKQQIKK